MTTENVLHHNEYALVTGATSGFGYELAKLLAKDGYNLLLVARSSNRLQEITDEIKTQFGVEVTPFAKDLFEANAAKELYESIAQMGVNVNILINDAGQGEWGKFVEIDLERSLEIIQLNISSLVALTKYFATDMVARGEGRILNVGSEAGTVPAPLLSVYSATKAFVNSFSIAVADELKDTGVTLTVLLPGAADTDFFHKANAEETVTYKEEGLQTPAEVAKDGYDALMSGDAKVVSGGKTKMHVFMGNFMSDEMNAKNMRKKMEVSEKEDGRTESGHETSKEERDTINAETGALSGDYSTK